MRAVLPDGFAGVLQFHARNEQCRLFRIHEDALQYAYGIFPLQTGDWDGLGIRRKGGSCACDGESAQTEGNKAFYATHRQNGKSMR